MAVWSAATLSLMDAFVSNIVLAKFSDSEEQDLIVSVRPPMNLRVAADS